MQRRAEGPGGGISFMDCGDRACDPMEPARLLCAWNSRGKNSGVNVSSLLQGIFPTQGSNPGLPQILYQLSHQGSLEHYNKFIMKINKNPP